MFDWISGILPQKIHFDLSMFPAFAAWLFSVGHYVFELLEFDFLGYTLNGWTILIGLAVFSIILHFIGRILE